MSARSAAPFSEFHPVPRGAPGAPGAQGGADVAGGRSFCTFGGSHLTLKCEFSDFHIVFSLVCGRAGLCPEYSKKIVARCAEQYDEL